MKKSLLTADPDWQPPAEHIRGTFDTLCKILESGSKRHQIAAAKVVLALQEAWNHRRRALVSAGQRTADDQCGIGRPTSRR